MAEALLPELEGDAEATPCPSVLELEELLRAGKASCSRVDEVWPNLFIGDAQSPRALCGGCEPLCHTGPGLPHAAPAAVPASGSDHCEGTPVDLPQPRLPPSALPAGQETAGYKPELRSQSLSLLPATGLCHFAALALTLLVLLEAVAHVDAKKMLRAQHGIHPQVCHSVYFLLYPSPHLGHWLQSPQKQHQMCRDRRLEAGSTNRLSEKTTACVGHPLRMNSLQKQDLRRPKIHGAVRASPYSPPTLASLQRLLWVRRATMLNHINEVWPNLFLGDAYAARDKSQLIQMGITHVVNAAAGKFQVDTGAKFYHGMPLEYYGIEADDNPFFDLSVYFLPVAQYIRTALSTPREWIPQPGPGKPWFEDSLRRNIPPPPYLPRGLTRQADPATHILTSSALLGSFLLVSALLCSSRLPQPSEAGSAGSLSLGATSITRPLGFPAPSCYGAFRQPSTCPSPTNPILSQTCASILALPLYLLSM